MICLPSVLIAFPVQLHYRITKTIAYLRQHLKTTLMLFKHYQFKFNALVNIVNIVWWKGYGSYRAEDIIYMWE